MKKKIRLLHKSGSYAAHQNVPGELRMWVSSAQFKENEPQIIYDSYDFHRISIIDLGK